MSSSHGVTLNPKPNRQCLDRARAVRPVGYFTVRGSTEDDDGTTHAHLIKMTGFVESLDEGEWKDGEAVPLKLVMSLRYYMRQRDGVELIEYDPINMKYVLNGKDVLAEHRANIGR